MDLYTEFKWSEDVTRRFIAARISKTDEFNCGKRSRNKITYQEILEELGLDGEITTNQARKKWNNLIHKYKEVKRHQLDGKLEQSLDWPYFELLDPVLAKTENDSHSPVTRDSEDYVSNAPHSEYLSLDEDSNNELIMMPIAKKKRKIGVSSRSDDPLLDLIKQQTEALQQHEESFNQFSNNVLNLLDRLVTVVENKATTQQSNVTTGLASEIIEIQPSSDTNAKCEN